MTPWSPKVDQSNCSAAARRASSSVSALHSAMAADMLAGVFGSFILLPFLDVPPNRKGPRVVGPGAFRLPGFASWAWKARLRSWRRAIPFANDAAAIVMAAGQSLKPIRLSTCGRRHRLPGALYRGIGVRMPSVLLVCFVRRAFSSRRAKWLRGRDGPADFSCIKKKPRDASRPGLPLNFPSGVRCHAATSTSPIPYRALSSSRLYRSKSGPSWRQSM